jgi:penicillin-binding protein A
VVTRIVLPLIILGGAAYGFGSYEAGAAGRADQTLVKHYLNDWISGNFPAMYALMAPTVRQRLSESQFQSDYANAGSIATITGLHASRTFTIHNNVAEVSMRVSTRVFGTLRGVLALPLAGDGSHVEFDSEMVFPGLRHGEQLSRKATLGSRGTLLASNGQVLAEGPSRSSPIPSIAGAIVGALGPIPAAQKSYYANLGYPPNAQVGQDGLELIFESQLAGTPGGTLLAGKRVLANVPAQNGKTVKTTIDPSLEQAALTAMGSSYAGITVLNPKTGGIEAATGIAFTDVQPPGSTFKIITAAAALQSGQATLDTEYPEESSTDLDGYTMQNAGGEVCGGTLINAFATSCDTTFAPLGAQLGAKLLVSTAERFGFNQSPGIASALESTIPSAATIGDPLAVGSSAIGQGRVEASTLGMADVAAAIADGGKRPLPTLQEGVPTKFVTATTSKVAGEVQQMMEAVVEYGTGTSAQIPGVQVAGKTGTAELANTANQQNDAKETDAWFVGYAPAADPKVIVCALYPNNGYGADSSAPAVREVLEAALGIS